MGKLGVCLLLLLPVWLIYFICCTPVSIHEFYTETDIAFDPALVGDWVFEESDEPLSLWSFAENDAGSYRLLYADYEYDADEDWYIDRNTHTFTATLFELDGVTYLDILPYYDGESMDYASDLLGSNSLLDVSSVRGHTLWRIDRTETGYDLSVLNLELVTEYVEEHPNAVQADRWGYDVSTGDPQGTVLLSSPAGLQQFIAEFSQVENAFGEDPLVSLIPLAESPRRDMIADPDPQWRMEPDPAVE